jgi:hypothetical protein
VALVVQTFMVSLVCGAAVDSCDPRSITSTDDAGCGRFFPRYHPKNAKPLAHNNDANAPFEYKGMAHLFMQANFPGVEKWNGVCCPSAMDRSWPLTADPHEMVPQWQLSPL